MFWGLCLANLANFMTKMLLFISYLRTENSAIVRIACSGVEIFQSHPQNGSWVGSLAPECSGVYSTALQASFLMIGQNAA